MDVTAIIVAVIAFAGTISGSWLGVRQSNLVNWRIDKLEEEVRKHNNLVERMVKVERDLKTVWKEVERK